MVKVKLTEKGKEYLKELEKRNPLLFAEKKILFKTYGITQDEFDNAMNEPDLLKREEAIKKLYKKGDKDE